MALQFANASMALFRRLSGTDSHDTPKLISNWQVVNPHKPILSTLKCHFYNGINTETKEKVMVKKYDHELLFESTYKRYYPKTAAQEERERSWFHWLKKKEPVTHFKNSTREGRRTHLRKIVPSWLDFRYMSLMEAKFGSLCQNHPHIIQTYDYHIDDESEELFVFMEKPEGSMNLQEYLNIHAKRLAKCKDQMLRERFAKEFVRQMISAIGYLHYHKIAHCDIKLDNFIVCPKEPRPHSAFSEPIHSNVKDSEIKKSKNLKKDNPFKNDWTAPLIKLCDMELCSLVYDKYPDHYQRKQYGYKWFYSPEMLNNEPYMATKHDIWCIGLVAYQLVCNRKPFKNMWAQENARIEFESDISPEMKHFIERCLNRKMAKRASIDELAHHPWLNNASSPHEEHEDYRTKRQYYEFTRIYDDIDMYIPEDHRTFKIQLTNEQMKKLQADAEMEEIVENFESGETDDSVDIHKNPDDVDIHGIARHHESYEKDETFQVDQTAIDWRIVDEACAGYWGWIRIFGTEVFPHDEFYSFLQEHAHMSFDSDMQRPEIALYVLIRTLYRNKHPCASFFRVGGSSLDHCKGNEEIVEDMKISLMEWRGRRSSLVTYVDDEQSRRTSDVSNVSDADTIRVSKAALLPVPVVPQISLVVE